MMDFNDANNFLDQLFSEVSKTSLSPDLFFIDHICYRTKTYNEYLECKSHITKLGAVLITEADVSGRPIATYKLKAPIKYMAHTIDVLEIPAPKETPDYPSGFEHIEVVISDSFSDFKKKHQDINFKENSKEIKVKFNNGTIKFHHSSLEKIIEQELRS